MDKFDNMMKKNRSDSNVELDIESILDNTHRKIRRRATRRKAIYTSPVAMLFLIMMYVIMPNDGSDQVLPGGELLIAGWENSWTEIDNEELMESMDQDLYNHSVDYLINDRSTSYIDDMDEILGENDLEAFMSFLKEA